MQTRMLGKTGLHLPILSFGASSLGQEFRKVNLDEALATMGTTPSATSPAAPVHGAHDMAHHISPASNLSDADLSEAGTPEARRILILLGGAVVILLLATLALFFF